MPLFNEFHWHFFFLADRDIKHETYTQDATYYYSRSRENMNEIDLTRPDALLDLGWFGNGSECNKDQSVLKDALGALIGEEFHGYH